MRVKQNRIYLTKEERDELLNLTKKVKHSAEKVKRVHILLLLDEHHGKVDTQENIAQVCQCNPATVSMVAKRFAEKGTRSIERKERAEPAIKRKVTGDIEAHIIAINCSAPSEGHSKWTLQLTSEKPVEMQLIDSISKDTVARALKKRMKGLSE